MIEDDILWRHVRDLPAFRALLRATEGKLYQDLLPLDEPVLDVGCGDGHFAAAALGGTTRPLAAGIDPSRDILREAARRGAYQLLAQASGDRLPFADSSFATVVSNSVLEHIPDVEPVLAEIARVLRPSGKLIFCVPSDHFTELLFFPQVLRSLRIESIAHAYQVYFNHIARHYHCDGPLTWQERLAHAGLQPSRCFYYFSARANHVLDLGHYLGLPNLISKWLFGRWVLLPTQRNPILRLTHRWLRPLFEEELPCVGACLFVVAHKP